MKQFDDNELEIAVLTRNRSEIMAVFLEKQMDQIEGINASFSVYDTSSDSSTEKLIKEYQNNGHNIKYEHGDYEKTIDEKYLDAILKSSAKYLWIMGDSNYMDIPTVVDKASGLIKSDYELIVVWNNLTNESEYSNVSDLFAECLWFMTWLGGPIVRRDIYKDIVTPDKKMDILRAGLSVRGSWYSSLGIMFEALSQNKDIRAKVINVKTDSLATVEKKQAWVSNGYKIWCKDLCLLVDGFGDDFIGDGNKAIKNTWKQLSLDKMYWSSRFRAGNSLNKELFTEYDKQGFIDRVSSNKSKIRTWAYMPRIIAVVTYSVFKIYHQLRPRLGKLLRRG